MKRLRRYFGYLINQERGAVVIIAAIMIVVLFGFAALVIDVGQLYAVRRQMVSAADGGALAGAMENYTQNTQKENRAREIAEDYAKENDAEYVNVAFTSESGNSTMHVRASRLVNFTFARVLGFEDSMVSAVASVQEGPGNPLVPFVDIAWLCECEVPCACEDECDCTDDQGNPMSCSCQDGCTCTCPDCGENNDNCECECPGGVAYDGKNYFIRDDDEICAQPGDLVQLKYNRWQESGFSSGTYPYVRFPGQQGGNDLRHDIGGGYSGTLESVKPGVWIREEGGHTLGPLEDGLEDRMRFANDPPCSTYEAVKDDPYICPLVVIIPMVHTPLQTDDTPPKNKHVKIVGYASFLLVLEDDDYSNDKEVYAILIEYIDWDRLQNILPEYLEGYVLKLVKTQGDPFAGVAIGN